MLLSVKLRGLFSFEATFLSVTVQVFLAWLPVWFFNLRLSPSYMKIDF